MADLGLTKLAACNQMLAWNGTSPTPALESTGSWPTLNYGGSEIGNAERVLDDVLREVQLEGKEDHILPGQQFVLASPGEITLNANVLRIEPSGRTRFIGQWTTVNDKVFNRILGTSTLPTGTYEFDLLVARKFEDCSPQIKELATKRSCQRWAQMKENPQGKIDQIAIDAARSDLASTRDVQPAPQIKPAPLTAQTTLGSRGSGQ